MCDCSIDISPCELCGDPEPQHEEIERRDGKWFFRGTAYPMSAMAGAARRRDAAGQGGAWWIATHWGLNVARVERALEEYEEISC